MATIGHNSDGFTHGELKDFVARIERLEEEKNIISADIKEIYSEAKDSGFDTKILRKLIALRKKDQQKREEEEAILELYMEALGMLASTPLGEAAIEREGLRG